MQQPFIEIDTQVRLLCCERNVYGESFRRVYVNGYEAIPATARYPPVLPKPFKVDASFRAA